jgi:hypothetical protein
MIVRLLIGLLKGLVVGGLLGFAVAKAGFGAPGAVVAYLGAALAGVLVGLVAGKPIWAKDAKIEAGMKAIVGALLGAGLMWTVRRWLGGIPFPIDLHALTPQNVSLNDTSAHGTLGGLAITSFAIVAAVLGAFYDADNTPSAEGDKAAASSKPAESSKTRVASNSKAVADAEEEDAAPPEKRAKR